MAGRGKESALDLSKFVDKSIRVKLAGGREGAKCAQPATGCRRAGSGSKERWALFTTASLLSHMCSCWSAEGV